MFQNFLPNDLVITDNKSQILAYFNEKKDFINIRLMTLQEFKNSYFGTYDERAIYYLMNKYGYKYEVAKLYLDNIYFLNDLKIELQEQNLIIYEPLFKESIKRIVVMTNFVDKYILKEIEKYDYIILNEKTKMVYYPIVKEYENREDEVTGVALNILELLKTIDITKIFLVVPDNAYYLVIKRIFKLFNLPINLDNKKNIYGLKRIQNFIHILKETKSVEEAVKVLNQDEIYNEVINICNKYSFKSIDDTIINMIIEELKKFNLDNYKINNAINVVNIRDINEDNYYFVLGFNQGMIPKIYKDEDFFSDQKKSQLGILTSIEKNILEKEEVINKITSNPHVFLSYMQKNDNQVLLKSSLIEDLNLQVVKGEKEDFHYSNLFNKLVLAKKLDSFIKFNKKEDNLSVLYGNYKDIPYLTYDNSYKPLSKDLFSKYFPNLYLSYTSLDSFYRCSFRYYLAYILNVNKFEETFMTFVGNLFHYILSKAFLESFNFEQEFNNFVNNKTFKAKENFFLIKLKQELSEVIEIIKKQNSYSSLNNFLYEQKVEVTPLNYPNVRFTGIIDKLAYLEENGQTYLAIIDYKTGNVASDLNNLIYGIDMQLPIYLYLSDYLKINNPVIVGFYLQKVISNKLNFQVGKSYSLEKEKLYKLNGFSTDKEDILAKLDYDYQDSKVVKGLKKSTNGFYNYSKILNNTNLIEIKKIVEQKISYAIQKIERADFKINPKKIGLNFKGCEFCSFKDICYKKEEDIISLPERDYHDFLGGDDDASLD